MKARNFFFTHLLLLYFFSLWCSFTSEQSETHTIVIKDMKFEPSELVVEKGDSIRFVNQDLVIHNVTEETRSWASPTIPPNSSWTCVVKEEINYYCSFHPIMKGKIKVR